MLGVGVGVGKVIGELREVFGHHRLADGASQQVVQPPWEPLARPEITFRTPRIPREALRTYVVFWARLKNFEQRHITS